MPLNCPPKSFQGATYIYLATLIALGYGGPHEGEKIHQIVLEKIVYLDWTVMNRIHVWKREIVAISVWFSPLQISFKDIHLRYDADIRLV